MFEVTSARKFAFPEAHAGVLVMRNVINPAHHPELEKHKTILEEPAFSIFWSGSRNDVCSSRIAGLQCLL